MNTNFTWPWRTSTTAAPRREARKPTASASASTKPSCRSSIRWRSANASTPASSSCRLTSMPGSPGTTNSDHIRGAGATARRQCKPSLTPSHSPGRNHWPPDVGQTQPFRHQTGRLSDQVSASTHIISAMEACDAYQPWHDKQTHKTYVRPDSGKCLHYYFYFIDAELGLVYLRVPTWAPFRLQFYCNGHSWLARQLTAEGIGFTAADNAFIRIDDWQRAQDLADRLSPDRLHLVLDRYAAQCCPVLDAFRQSYHWSLMQVEYSTDLVFRSQATLRPLYEQLTRQAVLSVKAEHVATFLGRKITPQLAQEIGSQFTTRIEGTCIKHRYGSATIKMYDKFALVLRLETTCNDVSAFKHHRKV